MMYVGTARSATLAAIGPSCHAPGPPAPRHHSGSGGTTGDRRSRTPRRTCTASPGVAAEPTGDHAGADARGRAEDEPAVVTCRFTGLSVTPCRRETHTEHRGLRH